METKPLILVCDDNKSISQLIVFVLQKAGFRAQAVASALDCVALARRTKPDLILMDIILPGMDGATASGLMRDIPELAGVPIVLLSGMPQEQVKERLQDADVKGYLLKPFRITDLLDLVRGCLSKLAPLKQAV